jgi:hypothetical protein
MNTSYAPTPTPLPVGVVSACSDPYSWFNFEQDFTKAPFTLWYGAGPTPMTDYWSTDTATSCTHSWKMVTGPGIGYGHWDGFSFAIDSTKPNNGLPIIPAGATKLSIDYKINASLKTTIYFDEAGAAGAPVSGGDGQEWSYTISITSSPAWQTFVIPLSAFTTASAGDGIFEYQSVYQFWFYHSGGYPYPAHTLYIDTIRFIP